VGVVGTDITQRLEDSSSLVDSIADAIDAALTELRMPVLDANGLLPALKEYAAEFSRRTGIQVVLAGTPASLRPPLEVEMTLFRIAQEALNNVVKHAQVAHVDIDLLQTDEECLLLITDLGVGVEPSALTANSRRRGGMRSMRERAAAVGGTFVVRTEPGNGTSVTVRVPLRSPEV
jgi:two-component system NarL family sensor kinase